MKTINRTWQYYLGNGLMAMAVLGLVWTFWPILREEWLYRMGNKQISQGTIDATYSIEIPSIAVRANVILGVDPFKPKVYHEALQHGVAQALHTALPGEPGTQFLFAHSSDAPWRMTRDNTAFFRLNRVKPGDEIFITYQGQLFRYVATELKIVWPSEVKFLKANENQLILQTCTPMGTDWKRLLVFARPVKI
jgi:sortase A